MNGSHFDKQTQRERTCSAGSRYLALRGRQNRLRWRVCAHGWSAVAAELALTTECARIPPPRRGEVAAAPVTPAVAEDAAAAAAPAPATVPAVDAAPEAQTVAEPQQSGTPTDATDENQRCSIR